MNTRITLEHEFLKQVTEVVENKLAHPQFGVSQLAKEMGISRSYLHRKIKASVGVSVSQFIRDVRLKRAMEMLKGTDKTCSEIAYDVGFGSVTYFNKCFHDHFGFPPGEVQKKKAQLTPADEPNEIPSIKDRKKNRLYSVASVFFLIVLIQSFVIYFYFNPFLRNEKKKSIMVLPFKASSGDQKLSSMLEGLHFNLISKLEIIEGLNVISSSTSNIYKDGLPDIQEISRIYDVDYILEGTGQKERDKIKIDLRMFDAKTNDYLWTTPVVYNLSEKDIFSFQEEAALQIADQLNTYVTPEEIEEIKFLETKNVPAFNAFTNGKSYMDIFNRTFFSSSASNSNELNSILEKAGSHFQNAIKLDSSYSQAYVFLGWYYHSKSELAKHDANLSAAFLDSALLMAEKAIELHPQHADGYDLETCILSLKGMQDESKNSADALFKIDKTDWRAYYRVAENHLSFNEYANALQYLLQARNRNIEPIEDERILKNIFKVLVQLGFDEVAEQFIDILLAQQNDSLDYFMSLARRDFYMANYEKALENQLKAYRMDSSNVESLLQLGIIHLTLNNENEMIYYFDKYRSLCNIKDIPIQPNKYLGYVNLKNNNRKEADSHFDEILKNCKIRRDKGLLNELGFSSAYEMACIYSVKGNTKKAIEALETYRAKETCPIWLITDLKNNPMLKNVRKRNEFDTLLKSLEQKLEGEQVKAEKILLDNGIIKSWQTKIKTTVFP